MSLDERVAKTLAFLREAAKHNGSQGLPINPASLYAKKGKAAAETAYYWYNRALGEYEFPSRRANPARFDYGDNPNHGWKTHLNVTIENAVAVADYLQSDGYRHKFLMGGDIGDGKIFTLYLGSFEKAQAEAERISNELEGRLAKPVDHGEIELAPGVVGRFRTERFGFNPYGTSGLSTLTTHINPYLMMNGTEEEKANYLARAEEASCGQLIKLFGDYFFPIDAS